MAGHRMNTSRNLSLSVSTRPPALFFLLPEGWLVFPATFGVKGEITTLADVELSGSDAEDGDGG